MVHISHPYKIQVQADQRVQCETRYTESNKVEVECSLKYTHTVDNFLDRIPMFQILTSITYNWDHMKLKIF